jgi:hypothetical protein
VQIRCMARALHKATSVHSGAPCHTTGSCYSCVYRALTLRTLKPYTSGAGGAQIGLDPAALNVPRPQVVQQAIAWAQQRGGRGRGAELRSRIDASRVFVYSHSAGVPLVRRACSRSSPLTACHVMSSQCVLMRSSTKLVLVSLKCCFHRCKHVWWPAQCRGTTWKRRFVPCPRASARVQAS